MQTFLSCAVNFDVNVWNGLPIALKQLSAGHYLLPLAPASWPKVGIHRWRRLGPDGVAELQMSVKAWFDERLKSKKLCHVEKHDHMLTESSLKVGNLVCTVMSSPSTPSMVQAPTMRSALAERQTPTTSSPTRRTTCSTRSLKSPARDDESRARTPGDKMAQISSATSRSRHVGRKGRPPVAFAKALLALAVEKWLCQAQSMVQGRVLPQKHLQMALQQKRFTMTNLGECVHLRQRLGLRTSFCEDVMLNGMLEAVPMKGMAAKLKKAAQQEALEESQKMKSDLQREEAARSMIGPKGGLPTLRGDLLRLASLLHVKVDEKDKIEDLKAKVRPIVNVLKEKPPPLTAAKTSAKKGAKPKSVAKDAAASSMSAEVRPLTNLTEKQEELQAKVNAMSAEITALRSLIPESMKNQVVDLTMVDVKSEEDEACGPTQEELDEINAAQMEHLYAERLMARYGTDDLQVLESEGIQVDSD